LLPVVEFSLWSSFLVVLSFGIGTVKILLDFVTPLVEDSLELLKHLWVDLGGSVGLGVILPSSIILFKTDVVLERFKSFFKLVGKLIEDREELLLLVIFDLFPVVFIKLVNKWLVDLVDDGVQRSDSVFGDLTEKNIIVISRSLGNIFGIIWVIVGVSDKVETFTLQLDLLTV
jgi:hypothetical protein